MSAPNETIVEDLRNALQLLESNDRAWGGRAIFANAAAARIRSALAKLELTPATCPECYRDRNLKAPMASDEPTPGKQKCVWCGFVNDMAQAPATAPCKSAECLSHTCPPGECIATWSAGT